MCGLPARVEAIANHADAGRRGRQQEAEQGTEQCGLIAFAVTPACPADQPDTGGACQGQQCITEGGAVLHQAFFSSLKARSAAARVISSSLSPWAMEVKPASKALGARYTPPSSIRWKKRLKRSLSLAITSAKVTMSSAPLKYRPNMPPAWVVTKGMPAASARCCRPSSMRVV